MRPPASGSPEPGWTPAARALLGLALVLALSRFVALGAWGLWVDEAHTLTDALWYFERTPQDYPLGYLAVAAVVRLRGGAIDEATLRLFPALCGWLSIPAAAWALRPALGPTRSSAVALLLSVSSWHLFWSQNSRAYTLALLLSLVATGLWLRGLLRGRRLPVAAGFAVGIAAALSHPSAALLLPAWVLAPLLLPLFGARLEPRPPVALLSTLAVLGGVALGGWLVGVWSTYERVKSGGSVAHFVATTGWYMTPLYLAGAAAGAAIAWRRRRPQDGLLALVVLLVAGLALAAATIARVAAQYVFVLLPYVAALATVPLATWRPSPLRWAVLALLALPPAVDSCLYFAVRHGDRPRWREAYSYVAARRGPEDLILGMHAPVGEYYLRPGETWLRTQDALLPLNSYDFSRGTLRRWRREERRVWLVVNPEDLMAWTPQARADFLRLLDEEARLEATWEVPWTPRDMEVRVYRIG